MQAVICSVVTGGFGIDETHARMLYPDMPEEFWKFYRSRRRAGWSEQTSLKWVLEVWRGPRAR